jgi:membrane-associated phospholipid phosphatase
MTMGNTLRAKQLCLLLLCIVLACPAIAQDLASTEINFPNPATDDEPSQPTNCPKPVYRVNYAVSGIFCLVATAADIYAIPKIIKNKKEITDAELNGLNKSAFNGFDQWAFRQDFSQKDMYYKASDYALPVIIASAGFLAFDKKIKNDWFKLLVMYYEMHAVTFSIYNFSPLGPAFQNKYRPVIYYDEWSFDQKRGGNNRNSMYSGHTATAIASTFFMVKVYSDYHPEIGNKKYWLYAIATIPPIVEGYLRVKALAHFPSDGLVGLIVGAACGIAVPSLHRISNHNVSVGLTATPVGPGLSLNWHPN